MLYSPMLAGTMPEVSNLGPLSSSNVEFCLIDSSYVTLETRRVGYHDRANAWCKQPGNFGSHRAFGIALIWLLLC